MRVQNSALNFPEEMDLVSKGFTGHKIQRMHACMHTKSKLTDYRGEDKDADDPSGVAALDDLSKG